MYPDAYEVGLPNQGVQILYEVLNERDWILAERTYAVWPDMEQVMRGTRRADPAVHRRRPPAGAAPSTCSGSASPPSSATPTCSTPSTWPASRCTRSTAATTTRSCSPAATRRSTPSRSPTSSTPPCSATARRSCSRSPRSSASGRPRAAPGGRDELLRRLAVTGDVYVPAVLRRRLRRGRHRSRRVVPNRPGIPFRVRKHTLMDLDAVALPGQAAGAARRDRARALLASRSSAAAPAAAASARPA